MIWWLLETAPAGGSWNMAMDEWLLDKSISTNRPVLRLYAWSIPTLSLGYAQHLKRTVRISVCRSRHIPVIRRMTGGKAVLHDRELTYAVTGPLGRFPFNTDLMHSYATLARGFLNALDRMGVKAEPASRSRTVSPGHVVSCFARPSAYEILVKGYKILGSAQKRTRSGVLQHGSLLLDYRPEIWRDILVQKTGRGDERVTSLKRESGKIASWRAAADAVRTGFASVFGIRFETLVLTEKDKQDVQMRAETRYADLLGSSEEKGEH